MKHLTLTFLLIAMFFSCTKEPGLGGTSTIMGTIKQYDLLHFDIPGSEYIDTIAEYFKADENIYIIYGDEDNFYDDDYNTSFDGSFRFDNLRKGSYTIFVYSDCEKDTSGIGSIQDELYAQQLSNTIWHNDCINGEFAKKISVEITENHQEINLNEISIFKIVSN
jgi:hypothetical protein